MTYKRQCLLIMLLTASCTNERREHVSTLCALHRISGDSLSSAYHDPYGVLTVDLPRTHIVCTGTAINSNIVLTAAHCVQGRDIEHFCFLMDSVSARGVAAVKRHPEFDASDRDGVPANDIALVMLDGDLAYDDRTALSNSDVLDGTASVTVIKTLRDPGKAAFHVSEVENDVVWMGLTEFAAGRPEQQQPCHGDSGGPAFANSASGARVLVGVLSRGIRNDCTSGAIYTRVDAFRTWIESEASLWWTPTGQPMLSPSN